MSDATHLLIPGAGLPPLQADGPPGYQPPPSSARQRPDLPNLAGLLREMQPVDETRAATDTPSLPYELVLARLLGLPAEPGRVPWAAFETRTFATPCGWVKPCHLQVGTDQVLLGDPALLALSDDDSRALMEAARPYFAEDGIQLAWYPAGWLATGEPLRDLPAWSMDRLIGRNITPELLQEAARTPNAFASKLRRLQNEMQMLFYTHPVNDARMQRRQPLVNSFWLTGVGVLDGLPAPQPHVVVENGLYASALALDEAAHAKAWQAVDAGNVAKLLADLRAGKDIRLTLAGERRAVTYAPAKASLLKRITAVFGGKPSLAVLDDL
jgi:hypothetical protein